MEALFDGEKNIAVLEQLLRSAASTTHRAEDTAHTIELEPNRARGHLGPAA
jgi:hypothetical protein